MDDNNKLLLERQNRILATMRGEKTDRMPLMWAGDMALIRYARPEATFKYMIDDFEEMTQIICDQVIPHFPKLDMLAAVGMSSRFLGAAFLCQTMLPGRELPENEMWQLKFDHFMKEDDYDWIIGHGWKAFSDKVLFEKLKYDPEEMAQNGEEGERCKQMYRDAGMPFAFSGMLSSPFDILAFSRGVTDFFADLYEYGDEIKEVMSIIMDEEEDARRDVIKREVEENHSRGEETMYAIAPCVQANCSLLGRDMFEEFGWPLIERQTNFLLNLGCKVRFHMDANWTNNLDLFANFPKGECIFDSDGNTDLEKTRDILGPVMAFTGTVHPAVFSFGTPDQVYSTVREQMATMGDSFIISPSCSIPANAPAENIDAMYAAATE